MLNGKEIIATVAVRDLAAAARFYEDVLGLVRAATEGDEAITYRSGAHGLIVYRSQYAGTNKATATTWPVGDDLTDIVTGLRAKGVAFEHYQLPGLQLDGDIHAGMGMKLAWFKDPDGNIFGLMGS